jgi:hypothetical protein
MRFPSHHFPFGVAVKVLKYNPVLLKAVLDGAKNVYFQVLAVLNASSRPDGGVSISQLSQVARLTEKSSVVRVLLTFYVLNNF